MAGLNDYNAELGSVFQTLSGRWRDLKMVWMDEVAAGFEREYWDGLTREVQSTSAQMARLADLVAKAQRNVK